MTNPTDELNKSAAITNATIAATKQRQPVTNFLTGERFGDDITDEQYQDIVRANETANKIGEYFGYEGAQFTPDNVISTIGVSDWANLNKVYGGASGLGRHYYNPDLVSQINTAYNANQAKAKQDALTAAQAEAAKDVVLDYGDNRKYTITAQNAKDIKDLIALDNTTTNADVKKQVAADLAAKLNAAGFAISIDPANPPKNTDELITLIATGDGGLDRYRDLTNILQEASRDRTPKNPKSFLDILREREMRQAEIDRATEERRINRARLGRGIADLAASVGDMIRASEGAPVSQRDWQRKYDELTAQEKANLDNYRLRMAKIRDDIKQQQLLERQQAIAAAKDANDKRFALQLEEAKQKGALQKQELADIAAKERAEIGAQGRVNAAKERAAGDKERAEDAAKRRQVPIAFGGKDYAMPTNDVLKQTLRELNGKLSKWGVKINLKEEIGLDTNLDGATMNGVTKKLAALKIAPRNTTPNRSENEVTMEEYQEIKDLLTRRSAGDQASTSLPTGRSRK